MTYWWILIVVLHFGSSGHWQQAAGFSPALGFSTQKTCQEAGVRIRDENSTQGDSDVSITYSCVYQGDTN